MDELENYALEHGIDGRGWMQTKPWRYVAAIRWNPRSTSLLPSRSGSWRKSTTSGTEPWGRCGGCAEGSTRRPAAGSWRAALWQFLEELTAAATLERWMAEADAAGRPDEVQEHRRAWQGVVQVLDEFAAALGDATPTVVEFRQIIEAGLETLRVGMVPPGLDQVMVGHVERSRQPDIRAALGFGRGGRRLSAGAGRGRHFHRRGAAAVVGDGRGVVAYEPRSSFCGSSTCCTSR